MISFSCWYCDRSYVVADGRVGERIDCGCGRANRVPRKSHGYSRLRTPVDFLVECLVYGGGGALLGFGLALLAITRIPYLSRAVGGRNLVAAATLAGFLLGTFGGEAGINWIGKKIRDMQDR